MFVLSMKMSRKKQIICAAVVAVVAVSAVLTLLGTGPIATVTKMGAKQQKPNNHSISSTQKIVDYLAGFGWEVDQEALEIKRVLIPLEFNETYQQYNEIQRAQNFDLERYRGITVKQYSFAVTNYPEHAENVRAHVLLDDQSIIGGDISLLELNGFTHGFQAP